MASTRRQLPPQIKKIEVLDRTTGKTVVRYRLAASAGINAETGKRQQVLRHYATEKAARTALAEITDAATKGTFVPRRTNTVREVCENYIAGRHKLRATSKAKLEYDLQPLIERYGDEPVQRLTKAHIDELVADLLAGGTKTGKGRTRRPWGGVAVNKFTQTVTMVLADAQRQGIVARNVAEHVDPVAVGHRSVDTYTEAEVQTLLASAAGDRLAHAWELALCGLRRGEIAGLRWADVDLEGRTLSIANNRVDAGGMAVENDPKSATAGSAHVGTEGGEGPPGDRTARAGVPTAGRGSTSCATRRACRTTHRCCHGIGRTRSRRPGCARSSCMLPGTLLPLIRTCKASRWR